MSDTLSETAPLALGGISTRCALRDPEALVSVVSSLRRASTQVVVAGGIWSLREACGAAKPPSVLGMPCGIVPTQSVGTRIFWKPLLSAGGCLP